MSLILQQQYVENQTNGAVTFPTGGSWVSAYCLHLGITEPNGTWIQSLCEHFGITEPLYGSWTIALAFYYGFTEPVNGTWWGALAIATAPVTDLIWDQTTTQWQLETADWGTGTAPTTPTFDQDGQDINTPTPTFTGTSEALCFINLTIDNQEYLAQADGAGVWSINITNPLPGVAAPGTAYSVDILCKDSTTGLESIPFAGSVNVIANTALVTVTMNTSWSLGWVYSWVEIQKLVSTGPEVWQSIEYNGNPTFGGGSFYKTDAGPYGATPGIYGMNFYSNDDSGTTVDVEREITLELATQYRIVGGSITDGTTYGQYVSYRLDTNGTSILPDYFPTDAQFGTVPVEQQTFIVN
jgi:hypothetical protein